LLSFYTTTNYKLLQQYNYNKMASDGITEIDTNLIESNYDNVVYSFDDLNLKKDILRGGYEF